MSSGTGFTGSGPGFYTAGNRSITNTMNNSPQPSYRSHPGIFLDQSSQMANRATLIGKRTLSEFQSHHQQSNVLYRSVNPRLYNYSSPASRLPSIEFSNPLPMSAEVVAPTLNSLQQQRYNFALQQLRPQPVTASAQETENKMMNRLHELEKQLLDDDDDNNDEGDTVSVIITNTTNSEWSEAIQNLITPNQKSISLSPTTSSSSSASSSVVSPSVCSKQAILEAAAAISEVKTEVAGEILTRLSQVANSKGNSEQRLTVFMVSALKSRMNPVEFPPPVADLYSKEHVASTQMLYDLSPCFKLGFMAANLAIIETALSVDAINNSGKLHVIDFDIGQGGQYMNLLHALSSRQNGSTPTILKITTVAHSANTGEEKQHSIGDMLSQLAKRLGIALQFNVVNHKVVDLTRDSLGCEPDEPVAVNFAFKLYRMPDESVSTENPRDELLRRVKGLSPCVVTLVEQEMNTNTAPFTARVAETVSYYGALLESMASTAASENSERVKVEEGLSRKLANSVACEGRERVERCEVFGKWRARMGMAGFQLKSLSQNVAESMRTRLSSGNRVNPGFTVKEENGGICFGWLGRTITVASAWH